MLTDKGFATILVITFVLTLSRVTLQVAHQRTGALVHLIALIARELCVLLEAVCLQSSFHIEQFLTVRTLVGSRMWMTKLDVHFQILESREDTLAVFAFVLLGRTTYLQEMMYICICGSRTDLFIDILPCIRILFLLRFRYSHESRLVLPGQLLSSCPFRIHYANALRSFRWLLVRAPNLMLIGCH